MKFDIEDDREKKKRKKKTNDFSNQSIYIIIAAF